MSGAPQSLIVLNQAVRIAEAGGKPASDAVAVWPDAARQELTTASSLVGIAMVEAIKVLHDKARLVAVFLRAQRVYEAEANKMADVVVDAARTLGRVLRPPLVQSGSHERKLPANLTAKQASLWRRLAEIPDELFTATKAGLLRRGASLSIAAILREVRGQPQGSRRTPGVSYSSRAEEPRTRVAATLLPWDHGGTYEVPNQTVDIEPPLPVTEFDEQFPDRIQAPGREGDIVAIIVTEHELTNTDGAAPAATKETGSTADDDSLPSSSDGRVK